MKDLVLIDRKLKRHVKFTHTLTNSINSDKALKALLYVIETKRDDAKFPWLI